MLSIIIPSLNEEKYLELLLASIKKQNYKDFEIILADAGSNDATIDIAKKYNCSQAIKVLEDWSNHSNIKEPNID